MVIARLTERAKKELYQMIDQVHLYATSLAEENEHLNAFWIHEHEPFHYTFGDGNTFMEKVVREKTWDKVKQEIPGLIPFMENFNLAPGIVVVGSAGIPAHRHNGGPNANWSLTVIKDSISGTVKFWYERDDRPYDQNGFIFDPDNELIFAEEAATKETGIYSFNTDVWHSWKPDFYDKRHILIYVFYFKDSITRDDVIRSIEQINNSYP